MIPVTTGTGSARHIDVVEFAAKAVRVHDYHADPTIDDIAEPKREGPLAFFAKAVLAGQDRIARPLVDAWVTAGQLASMILGDMARSPLRSCDTRLRSSLRSTAAAGWRT